MKMRYRGGHGGLVQFIPCRADDAIAQADEAVEKLLEEGMPLSTSRFSPSAGTPNIPSGRLAARTTTGRHSGTRSRSSTATCSGSRVSNAPRRRHRP